jgi:hypothetical protein
MSDRLPGPRHKRRPQDTPSWCTERAEADRIAAAAAGNDNVRMRFQLSAESWSARAEILQRFEDGASAPTDRKRAGWREAKPASAMLGSAAARG